MVSSRCRGVSSRQIARCDEIPLSLCSSVLVKRWQIDEPRSRNVNASWPEPRDRAYFYLADQREETARRSDSPASATAPPSPSPSPSPFPFPLTPENRSNPQWPALLALDPPVTMEPTGAFLPGRDQDHSRTPISTWLKWLIVCIAALALLACCQWRSLRS